MNRTLPFLALVLLAACGSSEEGRECVSERRGVTEAAGTVTLRFIARGCADPAECWGTACSWVEGGLPLEVECRLPIGGVGRVDQAPAAGCDVAAWSAPREPGESLPVYLALRCAAPGPFLFFTLPDLRTLDHDWPLSLPVVSNQEVPGGPDAPACLNWWDDSVLRCASGADDPTTLEGLVEVLSRTEPGTEVPEDFRVSLRVEGHVPGLYGAETTPCTKMIGLDFELNLVQTAADYGHCQ